MVGMRLNPWRRRRDDEDELSQRRRATIALGQDSRGRQVDLICAPSGGLELFNVAAWAGVESSASLDAAQADQLAAALGVPRSQLREAVRGRGDEILAQDGETWLRAQGFEPERWAHVDHDWD